MPGRARPPEALGNLSARGRIRVLFFFSPRLHRRRADTPKDEAKRFWPLRPRRTRTTPHQAKCKGTAAALLALLRRVRM